MTQISIMAGELGDIFWDLSPWITYSPGFDLGCRIYVANPTDIEKEYALLARLSRDTVLVSEEALPVFGYTWFKVADSDFVRLQGALRFEETDIDLTVLLVERESGEATDSVSTQLVSPATAGLLPPWPGGNGTSDWSSLLSMMLPFLMLGIVGVMFTSASRPREEKEKVVTEERKLLPPGREI